MAPDSCFSSLLADCRNELRPLPVHMLSDLRRGNRNFLIQTPAPPIYAIENFSVATPDGPIAVRAYRPSNAPNLPSTLYCHGGGFVAGDLETHDVLCRSLALSSNCTVFAVEYRLAPETRFPGPVHDCHRVLTWLSDNAATLNIDGARLAACGDSAGANLAVAAALLARESGPRLRHLGLIYPITDAACDTHSMSEFASGYLLTRAAMQWFWSLYLEGPADASNPLASILRADVSCLPPTTVLTAQFDPLRDEGELFVERLRAADISVAARRFDGMIHGFVGMPHVTPMAGSAIEFLSASLRSTLL
jgi:acetyl esterase/lipase